MEERTNAATREESRGHAVGAGRASAHLSSSPPPGDELVWLSTESVHSQLDRMDLAGVAESAREFSELVGSMAHETPRLAVLYLYDLLRTVAERLSLRGVGVDESQRLIWMNALAATRTSREAVELFQRELARLLEPFRNSRTRINPIVIRARRFIEEHADERISLSRVAEAVGVARNYLSSLFRKECSITLTEYIHTVRIERARRMLRAGSGSLAEVATAVGYQNYRHFYRSFLKIAGTSPTGFMRQLEESGEGQVPGAPAGLRHNSAPQTHH